jgi:hypothetical protein
MNGKIITILLTAVLLTFGFGQVSAQICTPAPIGLVSAYSGDGNALDARSRNNGTIQGNVTYAAGNVGQGFQLSGANGDRVLIGNPRDFQRQEFTIEAWIKRSSSSIVTNSPNAGSPGGIFFAYGQGGYAFLIDQNTNRLGLSNVGNSIVFSTSTITDTNWHHVAVTQSGPAFAAGTGAIFYIDGVADVRTGFQPPFTFTTNAAIGSRGDGQTDNVFFGAIDELAIYNRELAASEIQSIYNSGTSGKCKPIATNAPENQVLWLAGDGDANDSSGNGNNGTLQSGSVFKVGKVGQSFEFDGTAPSQITIPDSQSLRPVTAVTVEAWINPSSAGIGFQGVVFKGNAGSAGGQPYSLFVNGVNHQIVVRVGNDSTFEAFGSISGIPANAYSHVAFTYDGTTVRIYINGTLDSSAVSTIGNLAQTNTSDLRIGGLGSSFTFTGGADEIGIYNRALTVDEIASISNAGLAGKYKVQSTVPADLAAWYAGDGNTNDLQGGNAAALQNGATYGNGKVGQGFQFDGVDDQITVPHNANQNGGTNLTVEAWINPSSLPHGGTIIQKRTSGNIGGYVFETTQPSGGGAPNGLYFVIMIGGVYQFLNPANVLTTNAWQHVAATYDGAFMRIYVNGVEVGNRAQTGTIDNIVAPVIIGRNAVNPSFAFQGGIDEPAIYNRALSAAEIRDQFYAGSGGKYKGAVNPAVTNTIKTGDATVTFANVTTAGAVHQTPLNMSLLPALPMGTNTGLNYDISTSAVYTNPTVCLNVSAFTPAQFANLRIYHLESGAWQNRTAGANSYPNLCTSGLTSLSPFAIALVAPSAANVSISGRVVAGKSGLSNVIVTLSGGNLIRPISAKTNNFGFYKFDNLPVGETYVLSVSSKKYVFSQGTRTVNLLDEIADADFEAEAQ